MRILLIFIFFFLCNSFAFSLEKSWEIILTDKDDFFRKENCFFEFEKASRKQTQWSKDLSQLFDQMLASAMSGDLKTYRSFFKREKWLKDQEIINEMAIWKAYAKSYTLSKSAWLKINKDSFYTLVVIENGLRRGLAAAVIVEKKTRRIKPFKRIFSIIKSGEKYFFTLNYTNEKVTKLIERELYTSLVDFQFRLSRKNKKLRQKLLSKKEKLQSYQQRYENFSKYNYDKYFEKIGYKKKDVFKMYSDIDDYNKKISRYVASPNYSIQLKYGLILGKIKIFQKPILLKNVLKEKHFSKGTIFNYIKEELYEKNIRIKKYFPKHKAALALRESLSDLQLLGYEKKVFRGKKYYRFFGISYSLDKTIEMLTCQDLPYYFFNKNALWEKELTPPAGFILARLIPYAREIQQVIKGDIIALRTMKQNIYDKLLKKHNLFQYYRVRNSEECQAYDEKLDILKLPTIDTKSFQKAFKDLHPLPKIPLENADIFLSVNQKTKIKSRHNGWSFKEDGEGFISQSIEFENSNEVELYVTRDKINKTHLILHSNREDTGFILQSNVNNLNPLFWAPKDGYKQKISFKVDLQHPKKNIFFAYLKLRGKTYGKMKIKAVLTDDSLKRNYDTKKNGPPILRYALKIAYYYNTIGSQNIATKPGETSREIIIEPEEFDGFW